MVQVPCEWRSFSPAALTTTSRLMSLASWILSCERTKERKRTDSYNRTKRDTWRWPDFASVPSKATAAFVLRCIWCGSPSCSGSLSKRAMSQSDLSCAFRKEFFWDSFHRRTCGTRKFHLEHGDFRSLPPLRETRSAHINSIHEKISAIDLLGQWLIIVK